MDAFYTAYGFSIVPAVYYFRGDIVTVLEAQRRAFNAESSLLAAKRQRIENRVDLHLAVPRMHKQTAASHFPIQGQEGVGQIWDENSANQIIEERQPSCVALAFLVWDRIAVELKRLSYVLDVIPMQAPANGKLVFPL